MTSIAQFKATTALIKLQQVFERHTKQQENLGELFPSPSSGAMSEADKKRLVLRLRLLIIALLFSSRKQVLALTDRNQSGK